MFETLLSGLNYLRKNPFQSLAITLAVVSTLSPKPVSNHIATKIEPLPNNLPFYGPDTLLDFSSKIDIVTRSYLAPLNRPSTLFFSNNELSAEDTWKPDNDKIAHLKDAADDFASNAGELLSEKINNFIDQNKDIKSYHDQGILNEIIIDIAHWTDIIAATISSLEVSGGTCGEIAALNAILAQCSLGNTTRIETISITNGEMQTHTFTVLNRAKESKLEKPATWGKPVILDSWSGTKTVWNIDKLSTIIDNRQPSTRQIYTIDNLPTMLTNLSWNKWKIKKCAVGYDLTRVKMPDDLKERLTTFISTATSSIIENIKKDFPKAYEILNKETRANIDCIKPH